MLARKQAQLDVEHLLLALLQQPDGQPVRIIAVVGGDIERLVDSLEKSLDGRPSHTASIGTIPSQMTVRLTHVLQASVDEAARFNEKTVSTGHMLLAIADEQSGTTARILGQMGINRGNVYMALRAYRRDHPEDKDELPVARPAPSAQQGPQAQPESPGHAIINPPTLAKPVGFNHGIVTTGGRLLFLAGQTALDAGGRIVAPGDVVAQYGQALGNLKAVVEAAGGTMQNIVQMRIFVRDRDDYKAHLKELGEVHRSFFGAYYPATALLEISRFYDEDALVEIEGIAVLGE
jgi:enamine deaminase RidA (YjgF/YER057c/UK114 family)